MEVTDQMNARNSQRPHVIKFVVAGICLSAAILLGITAQFRTTDRTQTLQAYFYDMNTGRVFAENSDLYAPIVAPSGDMYQGRPAGARAYIFTCDECGDYEGMTTSDIDAAGGFIGYIEIYTEQAIQNLNGQWTLTVKTAKVNPHASPAE